MKVWTNCKFKGKWPVGTAAVVVADTADQAAALLNEDLADIGLARNAKPEQFEVLPTSKHAVRILCDGNY